MGRDGQAPGSAGLQLAGGAVLLRPEEQVIEAMLEGWRVQQLARNLAFSTICKRLTAVAAFTRHADALRGRGPRRWLDEWLGDLRAVKGLRRTTIRSYALTISAFCRYLTDPAVCGGRPSARSGSARHPVQVFHEWNTAVHVQDAEGGSGQAGVHRRGAAGVLRPRRWAGPPGPRPRPQGLAAGVPGRRLVQGRLRVRAAPHRDPRCSTWPTCGTNPHAGEFGRLWAVPGAVRQGQPRLPTQAAQRADRLAVAARRAGAVDRGGPPAVRPKRRPRRHYGRPERGPADQDQHTEPAVHRVPGRPRPGRAGWTSTRCAVPMCTHLIEDGWTALVRAASLEPADGCP